LDAFPIHVRASDWGEGRRPKNWGVEVNVVDENGKPVYSPSGEIKKAKAMNSLESSKG